MGHREGARSTAETVGRISGRLKLQFAAAKSPPSHVFEPVALAAAGTDRLVKKRILQGRISGSRKSALFLFNGGGQSLMPYAGKRMLA
jgi:hypothetical protein